MEMIEENMIRLTIMRIANRPTYCIGRLYINGEYFCDTLEDTDRGLRDEMTEEEIKAKKVYGETAIPTGVYNVILNYSPKFKKVMPLLQNVKGFSGVRIHSGNTDKDSLGCILVGKNKVVGKVVDSRATYDALFKRLQQRGKDKIVLQIVRMFYA